MGKVKAGTVAINKLIYVSSLAELEAWLRIL